MERLTKRIQTVVCYVGKHRQYSEDIPVEVNTLGVREILDRLAAYEDTGLMPGEIEELLHDSTGPLPKKLGQWIDAERDGRLVILPCKEYDKAFILFNGYVEPATIRRIRQYAVTEITSFFMEDIGKTVFFTRAEAEAALKGVENTD